MNFRSAITTTQFRVTTIAVCLLLTTIAVAQTTTKNPAPQIATAQIPFDFWIDDTHLPAGEYALYPALRLDTLLLLRNTKTSAQEQIFLVPTGDAVANGDYKLVFVTRAGQHYLREVWEAAGKAVLTSQAGVSLRSTDSWSEVPLVGQNAAKKPAIKVAPAE